MLGAGGTKTRVCTKNPILWMTRVKNPTPTLGGTCDAKFEKTFRFLSQTSPDFLTNFRMSSRTATNDKKVKLKNEEKVHSSVKLSFNKAFNQQRNNARQVHIEPMFERFKLELDLVVKLITKLTNLGQLFVNFHLCRLLTNDRTLPTLDQDFFYRVLICFCDTRRGAIDPEFQVSINIFLLEHPRVEHVDLDLDFNSRLPTHHLTDAINQTARSLLVSFVNKLTMDFQLHLVRLCRLRFDCDKLEDISIVEELISHLRDNQILTPKASILYNEFGLDLDPFDPKVVTANLYGAIEIDFCLLAWIEAEIPDGTRGKKLWTVAPVTSYQLNSLPVSNTILTGLLGILTRQDRKTIVTEVLWMNYDRLDAGLDALLDEDS